MITWLTNSGNQRVSADAKGSSNRVQPVFAEAVDAAAQPFSGGVDRALESLAKLGAPVLVEDAQQIAGLSRQNNRAAVDAAEKILDRYTLMRVLVERDGYPRLTVGGAS